MWSLKACSDDVRYVSPEIRPERAPVEFRGSRNERRLNAPLGRFEKSNFHFKDANLAFKSGTLQLKQ